MLEVVSRICASDNQLAAIVYHANASSFAYHRYGRAEVAIVSRILSDAGEAAEAFAVESFSSVSAKSVFVTDVNLPGPSEESIVVDIATLQDGLVAAVGPHDAQGKAPKKTPANSNWPNTGHPWSYMYSPIAASVIGSAISGALHLSLTNFAVASSAAITTSLSAIATNASRAVRSTPRQLNILWWMQALYSPTLRRSYRDLDVAVATVAMAHDLMALDVVPCPEGVVHVLGEAVRDAVADHEQQRRAPTTLTNWLTLLAEGAAVNALRPIVGDGPPPASGTAPLLEVVRAVLRGHKPPQGMLGALSEEEASPRQLAMWLFRDLVAERLARSA
jgi:hypothetical protein